MEGSKYKSVYTEAARLEKLCAEQSTALAAKEKEIERLNKAIELLRSVAKGRAGDIRSMRAILMAIAASLYSKNPLDAPWSDTDWNVEAHISNYPTLTIADAREIIRWADMDTEAALSQKGGE
jgi:hypothetical protein